MKQVVQKSFKKAAELNCSETCEPGCKWKYKTCNLKIRTNFFMLRVFKHWNRLLVESAEFHGLWRYSKSDGKWSWATLSRQPCFGQRLGLDDPKSPLPNSVVMSFCEPKIRLNLTIKIYYSSVQKHFCKIFIQIWKWAWGCIWKLHEFGSGLW